MQSGFRSGHSTGTCMMTFLDKIYNSIDTGDAVGVLFVDLSKAFYSIDHKIMIDKLGRLGFRRSSIKWFEPYLDNRKQMTKVNSSISTEINIECGEPQGSILGPLLFICYTNDLPNQLKWTGASIYADDTAIMSVGKSIPEIRFNLQSDTEMLHRWFDANKLSLNKSK